MNQQKLIDQIHSEFDTAQDRLLQQANEILSKQVELSAIEKVGERLEAVGFINTPTAQSAKGIKEKKYVTKGEADLIKHYKQDYPFLKFLTESELDRICLKYKLHYAPISRYVKDVPEKNLTDIENAQKLNDADKLEVYYKLVGNGHMGDYSEFCKILGKSEPIFTIAEHKELLMTYRPDMAEYYTIDDGTGWFVISKGMMMGNTISPKSIEVIKKDGLFIAAPESHFDTKGLVKKGLGFFSVFKTEVKDPIVFRYVKGGIQVITKWGLEANDPALVVPQLN